MSSTVTVHVLCEGKTEQEFVNRIIQPALSSRQVYVYATQVSKPGQKGGDVKFPRVQKDIRNFLTQRNDTYVTTFLDYYSLDPEWPGYKASNEINELDAKCYKIANATTENLTNAFPAVQVRNRFIPYFSMHEIEALYFGKPNILAEGIGVEVKTINDILAQFNNNPELINNHPDTAPSKRILKINKSFIKTVTGIRIAERIGLEAMRDKCAQFNRWLTQLENLEPLQ